jgi:hypothetical protein
MTKKILSRLCFLLVLIISVSCSKKEEIKKLSSTEITNFLLVNEQLPVKTLSNALEWPEDIILGVDLGLIELNEDGAERLNDIFEDYSEDGKDEFIKDYHEKKWSEFVKNDWIKSETTKISILKLNEIKKHEFKNNAIIQNKLNDFVPSYIKRQTEELSSYQLSFFSKGFWINLGQISWMQIKSTFWGKFTNRNLYYMDPKYKIEFQQKWEEIYKSYFNVKDVENEINNIAKNYQFLIHIKQHYLVNLKSKRQIKSDVVHLPQLKLPTTKNIDIKPIISKFNLTIVDDFGFIFLDILFGILIATIVNYFFRKILLDQVSMYREREHAITTFVKTGFSPLKAIIGTGLFVGNLLMSIDSIEKTEARSKSISSKINSVIGFILLIVSLYFFSSKKTYIENEISQNIKIIFSSSIDNTSIMILDDLNLNTELFYTSI